MKLQEHEYKARDKTVHKMSRDGLREENLHNKEEKRITSRDEDIEVSRNPKKEEDFGKNRRERITESKDIPTRKKPFDITRYSIDEEQKVKMEQDLGNEDAKEDISLMEDSGTDKHAVFRTESIRGQPRSERAALETAVDSRKLRQRKMVRDYAEREKRKEKEASRQQKTAEKENIRYRETSQVTEESLEGFQDEIKGKAKRERILKEQKKQSRLSFGDEGDGMVHGAGTGIRKSASAVKTAALTVGHWKAHEAEDDNAAVEGAHRMELAGESLARKSVYVRQRLRESRKQSARLTENMLDEAENSRLMFDAAYRNQAKNAVKREADQKKKSALQKLLQKKRYQKQYRAAKESKKAKDAAITSAQRFTEKTKDAVKMVAAQNKGIFATIALFGLIFVLIAASFSSCSAVLQGGSSAIISTSYSSTDEDIYAAENAYKALEEVLNTQINQIESRHPDYDEYRYQIDEIGHNPYQLISYLTVKYGGFTYAEVADEIKEIFQQQYGINTQSTRETVTETLSLNEFLDNFDYYYRSTIINSPCSKIYKKSILKDLRFNVNIRLGEDFDFNLKYLDMCKSVSVISGSSYIYDCTIAGTATKIYRTGSFEEILQVNLKGKEFCKRHNVREYNKSLDEYLCLNGIHLLDVLANSTNTFDYKHKESSVLLENQVFRNACKSIENKYGPKTIISKYLCLFNNYLLLFLFFRIKKLLKKMKVASKRIWKIKEGSLQ